MIKRTTVFTATAFATALAFTALSGPAAAGQDDFPGSEWNEQQNQVPGNSWDEKRGEDQVPGSQ